MSTYDRRTRPGTTGRTGRTSAQWAAILVAAAFLLVGALGFVPGATTDLDQLDIAGHGSGAQLLGIFQVSVLHNVVHLLFGAIGVVAARSHRSSCGFLVGSGVVYLVLWLYGTVVGHGSSANFVPLDDADNWLHLVLGAGMLGLGLLLGRDQDDRGAGQEGHDAA
jgi:Domain of unknown function (DUF4383)